MPIMKEKTQNLKKKEKKLTNEGPATEMATQTENLITTLLLNKPLQ